MDCSSWDPQVDSRFHTGQSLLSPYYLQLNNEICHRQASPVWCLATLDPFGVLPFAQVVASTLLTLCLL